MNETKKHILTVAFQLFLQKPFKEVTMREIVEKTGLSKGAFYHYFESKEQLFAEVVENFYVATPTTTQKPLNVNSLFEFYNDYMNHVILVFQKLKESMQESNSESDYNLFSLGLDAMRMIPGFKEKNKFINDEVLKIWTFVVANARKNEEIETEMSDLQVAKIFMFLNEGIGSRLTFEGRGNQAANETLELWNGFYNEIKKKQ